MGGNFEESPELLTVAGVAWSTVSDYGLWCQRQKEDSVRKEIPKAAGTFDSAREIYGFQVMRSTPMDAIFTGTNAPVY